MELYQWASPMMAIALKALTHADLQVDVNSDLNGDGLYLREKTSAKVYDAFKQAGYACKLEEDGAGTITHAGLPQRGLSFCRAEDEPECMVWFFFNEGMTGENG